MVQMRKCDILSFVTVVKLTCFEAHQHIVENVYAVHVNILFSGKRDSEHFKGQM